MVFGRNKDNEWSVIGLGNDETVVEIINVAAVLSRDKPEPFDSKEFGKFFIVVTNKRILEVNYKTKLISNFVNLDQVDVIAGAPNDSARGTITFLMKNNNQKWWSATISDNVRVVQIIQRVQNSLNNSNTTQSTHLKSTQSISNSQSSDEPLKILKLRFAKGEITKEEFEETKRMLE